MWPILVLLAILVLAPRAADADQDWGQACILASQDGYRPYEPSDENRSTDRQSGVSYSRVEIDRNRKTYPLDVFVGYTPDGRPQRYCMRFEIHNAGANDVIGVRWPFAGLKFGTLTANGGTEDRKAVVEDPKSDPEPDLHDTELRIFENKPGEVTTYMSQKKVAAPPREEAAALESLVFSVAHLETAIAEPVKMFAESHPNRTVESFEGIRLPGEYFELEELTRRLSSGGVILAAQSRVEPTEEGGVRITNELRVEGGGGARRVAAPYLLALRELGGTGNAEVVGENYGAVIDFVEEARHQWLSLESDGESLSASQVWSPEADWSGVLPVVDHPVAMETDSGIDCMLVPAYAPAPWPFSLDDCPPAR